jgi:surface antigen
MFMNKLPHAAALVALLFAISTVAVSPALADPPPWAPAHGWRDKHDRDDDNYRQERRHHRDRDDEEEDAPAVAVAPPPPPAPTQLPYGLTEGTCHRDLVGAALGGAAGGLVGSNIGKGSGRTAATIGGVIAGLFVGGSIGRSMDMADQACTGEVLEHVQDNQTVVWQGQNQSGYWVTPMRSYEAGNGSYCREYESDAVIDGRRQQTYGTACRQPDGRWQIAN